MACIVDFGESDWVIRIVPVEETFLSVFLPGLALPVQVDRKSRVLGRVDARMRPRPPFEPAFLRSASRTGHEA